VALKVDELAVAAGADAISDPLVNLLKTGLERAGFLAFSL
jgi:hypothetical protein